MNPAEIAEPLGGETDVVFLGTNDWSDSPPRQCSRAATENFANLLRAIQHAPGHLRHFNLTRDEEGNKLTPQLYDGCAGSAIATPPPRGDPVIDALTRITNHGSYYFNGGVHPRPRLHVLRFRAEYGA